MLLASDATVFLQTGSRDSGEAWCRLTEPILGVLAASIDYCGIGAHAFAITEERLLSLVGPVRCLVD